MTDKTLNDKAIDIKGKDYVLVKDRIIYFNEKYPNGAISTDLISTPDADTVVMKAQVCPDTDKPQRIFTGYSQAKWGDGYINKTSALENCETSCVGRALAMMGIGVIDSIASVDEIVKANNVPDQSKPVAGDVMDDYMIKNPNCPKCGSVMKKSTKGNWYCSQMCWKK